MTRPTELTRAGAHEAGHVVVVYALGRRVTLVRLGREAVPDDHPHIGLLEGAITGAETQFSPALGTEINRRVREGEQLAEEHIEWLQAELVTCYAGALAETQLFGSSTDESALADLQQAAIVVRMLGITADADGGSARLSRAGAIAETIIDDLSGSLERVAVAFSRGHARLEEAAVNAILDEAGVHNGSHRDLLVDLGNGRSRD
jgi:hypothetical protein